MKNKNIVEIRWESTYLFKILHNSTFETSWQSKKTSIWDKCYALKNNLYFMKYIENIKANKLWDLKYTKMTFCPSKHTAFNLFLCWHLTTMSYGVWLNFCKLSSFLRIAHKMKMSLLDWPLGGSNGADCIKCQWRNDKMWMWEQF